MPQPSLATAQEDNAVLRTYPDLLSRFISEARCGPLPLAPASHLTMPRAMPICSDRGQELS
jgi:hypothetical protein